MNRRRFLASASSAGIAGLAGCASMLPGNGGDDSSDASIQAQPFGTPQTVDGIELVPQAYKMADRWAPYGFADSPDELDPSSLDENDYNEPETIGGDFMLLLVRVTNFAQNSRPLPANKATRLYLGREPLDPVGDEDSFFFRADGENYVSYTAQVVSRGANESQPAFPGLRLRGIIIYEAPVDFSHENMTFRSVYGRQAVSERRVWSFLNGQGQPVEAGIPDSAKQGIEEGVQDGETETPTPAPSPTPELSGNQSDEQQSLSGWNWL